jgi:hypothetical protein
MARGTRALLYHVYYLSALLTLRTFRNALCKPASEWDCEALACLTDSVRSALRDPSRIARLAAVQTQEEVPARQFAPVVAFGEELLKPEFCDCIPPGVPTADPILGGDLVRTAAILSHSTRAALIAA